LVAATVYTSVFKGVFSGDIVAIYDGQSNNPPTRFMTNITDTDPIVPPAGVIAIPMLSTDSSNVDQANYAAAINSVGASLAVTATVVSFAGVDYVLLTQDVLGVNGNQRTVTPVPIDYDFFLPPTPPFAPSTPTAFFTGGAGGGVQATGSIACVAASLISEGETFTISDGINPPVTFTFTFIGVSPAVDGMVYLTITDTAVDVARAIAGVSTPSPAGFQGALRRFTGAGGPGPIEPSTISPPSFRVSAPSFTLGGVISLRNDFAGTAGNVTITDTVAAVGFVVSGMSGGAA
jgi:hypothetical protein